MAIDSMKKLLSTVYTEHLTPMHTAITEGMVVGLTERIDASSVVSVLDVGCGMGVAWPSFRKAFPNMKHLHVITPDAAEQDNAEANRDVTWIGLTVDNSSLYDGRYHYDLIWARHSLEHFTSPFLDLCLLKERLVNGGRMYVEVPAPDTVCHHESNPNHYSVMGKRMWASLFDKAGFKIEDHGELKIELEIGPDTYFWFLLQ